MLEKLKTLPPVQALAVQINGKADEKDNEESEKKDGKKKVIFDKVLKLARKAS